MCITPVPSGPGLGPLSITQWGSDLQPTSVAGIVQQLEERGAAAGVDQFAELAEQGFMEIVLHLGCSRKVNRILHAVVDGTGGVGHRGELKRQRRLDGGNDNARRRPLKW